MKTKALDLTQGNITKLLLAFSLPILFANIFQQLYNTVDTMIVGHYLGDNALAALGSSVAIYELLVGFTIGVGSGFSIVVAKHFGSKNEIALKRSVASSIVLSVLLSVFVMLLSAFVLEPFLILLNTPKEILADAHLYIFLICMAVGITMAYNLVAGFLRAIGDSVTPLIVLFLSSLVNIILDIAFISIFQMGIAGAAIATIIAQAFATIICIVYIIKKCPILKVSKKDFIYEKTLYSDLISQGSSMGFMLSIVSLGTLVLQGSINAFGTLTIAAHTTARKLTSLLSMPLGTLATAVATFASQNKGANLMQRVKDGVKQAILLSTIWSVIATVFTYLFATFLVQLISGTSANEVIEVARLYLHTNIPFLVILGPLLILRSALQGIGKKIIPLISSIIELIGKVVFVSLFIPLMGYLGVCFSEPVIWILMCIQLLYAFYFTPEIRILKKSIH